MTTTPKPKTDRVTLRGDDALTAWVALRASIQRLDELAEKSDFPKRAEYRAEQWEAYQRIAKALGLKATLATIY